LVLLGEWSFEGEWRGRCASCLFEIVMPESTVFVAGSRQIAGLPAVASRLDTMIEKGFRSQSVTPMARTRQSSGTLLRRHMRTCLFTA
jgi:hypothetical protein